jgi:hypothetical protein
LRVIRRAIAVLVGAFVLSAAAGAMRPAQALTCAPDLEDACRVVATVVCAVAAKGKPCLG